MNPINWQLAVDAVDAHTLADFWAEALHYTKEDNTAAIEQVLAQGYAEESDTVVIDGVRAWAGFEAIRGDGRRILFHTVPEPKTAKNRWHIDLNVGTAQLQAEMERLVGLGAVRVQEINEKSGHFIVMKDPEGNEFCIQ
jgi:hypothetical protein